MDWVSCRNAAMDNLKKYRYLWIVVLLGFVLMLFPEKEQQAIQKEQPEKASGISVQESLERILSQVEGAGKVAVLLTEKTGEQILYQTDDTLVTGEHTAEKVRKTVMGTTSDRTETGLVRQVNPPTFQGAVIVCQGADDPRVKLAMVEAVMGATGLPSNCIRVLKMK